VKVSLRTGRALGKQIAQIALVVGSVLVLPSAASASVSYTYYPSGAAAGVNDLADLDHAYYYTWNLAGLTAVKNQGIISASITFKDMYNWDANSNVLHLDLLDAATLTGGNAVTGGVGAGGVTSTARSWTDNAPVTPLKQSDLTNDVFDQPAVDVLDIAGQPNHANLSDRAFIAQNTGGTTLNPTNTGALTTALQSLTADVNANTAAFASSLISPPDWSWSGYASNHTTVGGSYAGINGGYDYTYTFTGVDLTNLIAYITNGGDVALAFDPDCHFFNDGVSFTITTSNLGGQAAVPEPASLLLLGTGLIAAGQLRRKKAKAAKQ
jgi:hypothetical protein